MYKILHEAWQPGITEFSSEYSSDASTQYDINLYTAKI